MKRYSIRRSSTGCDWGAKTCRPVSASTVASTIVDARSGLCRTTTD